MSQPQSRRGRRVAERKRNPLIPFYWAIGALVVVGAAFLITFAVRGGFGGGEVPTINAQTGQTPEGFWFKGDPEAVVTVVEYADYRCPACAFFDRNMSPIITRDYVETGKIQMIFHEFPLNNNAQAISAAEAARCAGDQGQFWEMNHLLMTNQGQWAQLNNVNNVFSGYAGQLGLDRAAFDSCMSAGTHNAAILAAVESSVARGVTGTPSFDVNGQLVDMNGLPGAIEAALRTAGQ